MSSGMSSEDEGERAPPTFRLRLGSYVSDFRLGRTRSQSPSSPLNPAAPSSPLGFSRQSHPLRLQTTALAQQEEASRVTAWSTSSPTLVAPVSTERDVDMDLDVQSTFQAMQVDSPAASPSAADRASFFPASATFQPQLRSSLSPITPNLLSPLNTDTRYPRSPSPLSPTSSSATLPSISLVAQGATVSPGVFPSQALLAARRSSRLVPQRHMPASSSPLARTPASFQNTQLHTYPSNISQQSQTQSRGRANSTPPAPVVAAHDENLMPPSPVRRHSDGRPSPSRLHAPV